MNGTYKLEIGGAADALRFVFVEARRETLDGKRAPAAPPEVLREMVRLRSAEADDRIDACRRLLELGRRGAPAVPDLGACRGTAPARDPFRAYPARN